MIMENIYELVPKSREIFAELGYSKGYAESMLSVVSAVVRLHNEQDESQLKNEIIDSYVKCQEVRYQNSEISRAMFVRYKTVAGYLTQIYNTGIIVYSRYNPSSALPVCFKSILSKMLANENWNLQLRKKQHDHTKLFFRWLHSHGHIDLSCVNESVVRESMSTT